MKKIFFMISMFVMLGFGSQAQAQFFFMDDPLQGKAAPEFKLSKLSGGEQTLTEFREGKKVILFFWATWCPHCREQLAKMEERQDELNQKGIKIAAIDLGEKKEIVQ